MSDPRSSSETVTLLPCPFCGGRAFGKRYYNGETTLFEAACQSCPASMKGFDQSIADAVDAWNTRTTAITGQGEASVVGWMARCSTTGGRLFAHTELTARLEGQLIYKEHGFTVEPLVVANGASAVPSTDIAQAGRVPDREAFWLVERMGTGLYVKTGPGDLTDNVWHAHRFANEREAFDYARLSQASWAKDLRATEHLFINKIEALSLPSTSRVCGLCGGPLPCLTHSQGLTVSSTQ